MSADLRPSAASPEERPLAPGPNAPPAQDAAAPADLAAAFAPHAALARHLLAAIGPGGTDGSHDLSHLLRVWRNAAAIAATEPDCDLELLTAAVLLHDCVAVEKNSPLRAQASRLAAAHARTLLAGMGWAAARLDALAHAIEAHSFSAGIAPRSLEARILQDADRLDAIGAIGIARCFYVGGRLHSALYDPADPDAAARPLDDGRFAFDHFAAKLFRLGDGFHTAAGRRESAARIATMRTFVSAFRAELGLPAPPGAPASPSASAPAGAPAPAAFSGG